MATRRNPNPMRPFVADSAALHRRTRNRCDANPKNRTNRITLSPALLPRIDQNMRIDALNGSAYTGHRSYLFDAGLRGLQSELCGSNRKANATAHGYTRFDP